ncbi:helix-turn-helix domain protein [bacterium BMS3Abin03]|nr:helix-turn-helix domain protein [bacterium BMS3Abin03]
MLKIFAEELKEAREKSGITLQQVSAKTRIDLKFLEAIESGDFSFLPELYVKAFIKQYAKVVGLDEEEVSEKYDAAKAGKKIDLDEEPPDEPAGDVESKHIETHETKHTETHETKQTAGKTYSSYDQNENVESKPIKISRNMVIAGAFAGVVFLSVLIYFLFISNGSDIIVEEKPYEEVLKDTPNRYIEEKKIREENTSQVVPEELTLTVTNVDSTDSAWVLVMFDDIRSKDYMLYPGNTITLKTNNNFKLTLGNSGVVSLKLNDVKLDFEGKKRVVRYFKVDASGIEKLHSPPKLNQK